MADFPEFYEMDVPPVWRLPSEHYEAIGRIAVNSAALEIGLGQVITRLAEVGERRGIALVDPYRFEQRITKIKQLLPFWGDRTLPTEQREAIEKIGAFVRSETTIDGLTLQEMSERRNKSIHRQWVGSESPFTPDMSYENHIKMMVRAKIFGKPTSDPSSFEFEHVELTEMLALGETFWKAAVMVRMILPILPIPGDD